MSSEFLLPRFQLLSKWLGPAARSGGAGCLRGRPPSSMGGLGAPCLRCSISMGPQGRRRRFFRVMFLLPFERITFEPDVLRDLKMSFLLQWDQHLEQAWPGGALSGMQQLHRVIYGTERSSHAVAPEVVLIIMFLGPSEMRFYSLWTRLSGAGLALPVWTPGAAVSWVRLRHRLVEPSSRSRRVRNMLFDHLRRQCKGLWLGRLRK